MRCFTSLIILTEFAYTASAQQPPPFARPPQPLPAAVQGAPMATGEALIRFDPTRLTIKQIDNRHQLWAGEQFLKDFGPNEREAREALRLVSEMHFTHYGTVAGSTPAFEYWLAEGGAARGGMAVKNTIPFNPRALKADSVTGAWIIRDDHQVLYNFGLRQDGAALALSVIKRYGFNQLGIIGIPNPVMTYLAVDPHAHQFESHAQMDPREIVGKLTEQGLMLPKIGYVGNRTPIDEHKLDVVRLKNEWTLVHGKEPLAHFGNNFLQAREGLRLLRDAHVTDLCLIGTSGFPIFLSNGRPPRHAGLGFNNLRLEPALMKAQMINNNVCLTEGDRIMFQFGDNRADGDMVLKVLQAFQFDQVCPVGDPANGGLRLFLKSR
jgi:hypothetical protein